MSSSTSNNFVCPRCGVGKCQYQTTTFVELYHGQLLCVPDVPVYICDVCHFAEFEMDAIESLWADLGDDFFPDDFESTSETSFSSPFGK